MKQTHLAKPAQAPTTAGNDECYRNFCNHSTAFRPLLVDAAKSPAIAITTVSGVEFQRTGNPGEVLAFVPAGDNLDSAVKNAAAFALATANRDLVAYTYEQLSQYKLDALKSMGLDVLFYRVAAACDAHDEALKEARK